MTNVLIIRRYRDMPFFCRSTVDNLSCPHFLCCACTYTHPFPYVSILYFSPSECCWFSGPVPVPFSFSVTRPPSQPVTLPSKNNTALILSDGGSCCLCSHNGQRTGLSQGPKDQGQCGSHAQPPGNRRFSLSYGSSGDNGGDVVLRFVPCTQTCLCSSSGIVWMCFTLFR